MVKIILFSCGDSFQDLGYKLNDVTGLEKVTNITNFPEWFKNKNNTDYLILVSEKNNKNFFIKIKLYKEFLSSIFT